MPLPLLCTTRHERVNTTAQVAYRFNIHPSNQPKDLLFSSAIALLHNAQKELGSSEKSNYSFARCREESMVFRNDLLWAKSLQVTAEPLKHKSKTWTHRSPPNSVILHRGEKSNQCHFLHTVFPQTPPSAQQHS